MDERERCITELLHAASRGNDTARDDLLKAVYEELRAMAEARLVRESGRCTMVPTDLVHETYLRVLGTHTPQFDHRRHFFSAAAGAMRRILIDRHRRRTAAKRGGDRLRVSLDSVIAPRETEDLDIEALGVALDDFAKLDSRAHQVVELRFFLGMRDDEIGELVGISERTVRADWLSAKGWLWRRMSGSAASSP